MIWSEKGMAAIRVGGKGLAADGIGRKIDLPQNGLAGEIWPHVSWPQKFGRNLAGRNLDGRNFPATTVHILY